MEDKKNNKIPNKIKRGALGQRLEELNEVAEELGYTEKLYPQERRFKKPTEEEMTAVLGKNKPQKEGLLETIKRIIDEVFGEGTVDWEKYPIKKKSKKKTD